MKRLALNGALAALALWTLLSMLTQVQPGERAVVRRFGRILEDRPLPGLFVGLPWGLDQVQRVPVGRVRRVVVGWAVCSVYYLRRREAASCLRPGRRRVRSGCR